MSIVFYFFGLLSGFVIGALAVIIIGFILDRDSGQE